MTREEERKFVVKEYKKMFFGFLFSLAFLALAIVALMVTIINVLTK